MSEQIRELIGLIEDHGGRVDEIRATLERALANEIEQLGKTQMAALIVAGLLENYYTCLETMFVRISQFFENDLNAERWHTDLLEKMALEIKGVRASVVSRENFPALFELLKFRHSRRYYFDLEYDWDRLDFLVVKIRKAHPIVMRDVERFLGFLRSTLGNG